LLDHIYIPHCTVELFISEFAISLCGLLCSSGAAKDSGYSITVKSTSAGDDGEPKAEVKVVVSNGDSQWEVVGDILLNTWTNIGFTWNNSDLGLSLFVDGVHVGQYVNAEKTILCV